MAKTSLVPVRRPSDEPIPGSSSAPSVPRSIDAVELPQWLDNAPIEELATEQDKPDSRPVLGLPSPPPRRRVPFLKLRLWNKEFVMVDETIAIRTIKSMLLVGKVRPLTTFGIAYLCDICIGVVYFLAIERRWSQSRAIGFRSHSGYSRQLVRRPYRFHFS